jgi:NADH-quinone oxidoreductase subunit G
MYRGDATLRYASALQKTADNPAPAATVNPIAGSRLGLADGDQVTVVNGAGSAVLPVRLSDRIPEGCVFIPAGFTETSTLGGHGSVTLEKS